MSNVVDLVELQNRGSVDVVLTLDDSTTIDIGLSLSPTVDVTLSLSGSALNAGGGGGSSPVVFEAVANETLVAGFPIAISRADGKMIKAIASYKPSAFVAGVLISNVVGGFVGPFSADRVILSDWSFVTGSVSLLPGRSYFLGNTGGLSLNPPGSGSCVVLVGTAIDATTLLVDIQPPIEI